MSLPQKLTLSPLAQINQIESDDTKVETIKIEDEDTLDDDNDADDESNDNLVIADEDMVSHISVYHFCITMYYS